MRLFPRVARVERPRRSGKSYSIRDAHRVANRHSQAGELTDKGRQTTFQLGQRLRKLYVDQLGYLPEIKSNAEDIYLRATPMPRALESLQQAFMGMYPASARTADFAAPAIVTRSVADETVYPNDASCRRFRQLSRLFADRAAQRCEYRILFFFSFWFV